MKRSFFQFASVFLVAMAFNACRTSDSSEHTAVFQWDTIALRPPMGWNSYDCFGGNVREDEVKANADFMADSLRKFGWEYIVVDFLWYCDDQDSPAKFSNRRPSQHIDEFGRLIPSELLYPSSAGGKGFKPLADYFHDKGLKFGIHIMRGIPRQAVDQNVTIKNTQIKAGAIFNISDTCSWYGGLLGVNMAEPGSQEYYNSLFELYASWGVDFVKIDDIVFPYHADEIEAVHNAMKACGRPMVLSLSPGPAFIGNPKHLREHANLWRISGDFWDQWESLKKQLSLCQQWAPLVTAGHWPDADMLPLGRLNKRTELQNRTERYSNFTQDEKQFLLTLWCIFRSPLMIGGNLPEIDSATLKMITNEEILRVNQHSSDNHELSFNNGVSIWIATDTQKATKYLAFLNTNDDTKTVVFPAMDDKAGNAFKMRDLWLRKDMEKSKLNVGIEIPAHGGRLISISQE